LAGHIDSLAEKISAHVGARAQRISSLPTELTFEVEPAALLEVCRILRDTPELKFEMLMDVAGVDYLDYGRDEWSTTRATRTGFSRGRMTRLAQSTVDEFTSPQNLATQPREVVQGVMAEQASEPGNPAPDLSAGHRFAVAYHLLSITHNHRLRLRVYCEPVEEPAVDSVVDIWASANWFEREAFDLFGIVFRGHPDLRRILTDYGFIGHPFRKDFPLIGNVEVRYDNDKKRVVYQPVSIEPRVLVPKVIRVDHRYDPALKSEIPAK
jgi:NADH-quinone oxidoreductase subunit C